MKCISRHFQTQVYQVFDYSTRWFIGATEVAGFFKQLGLNLKNRINLSLMTLWPAAMMFIAGSKLNILNGHPVNCLNVFISIILNLKMGK